MKRKRQNIEGDLEFDRDRVKSKKEKKKVNLTYGGSTGKEEKDKLKQFYELELNFTKGKTQKKNKTSEQLDLLNDDYERIKEIAEQVKEQVKLNKCLLRTRILLQKPLTLGNKLPLFPYSALTEQLLRDKKVDDTVKDVLCQVKIKEEKIKRLTAQLLSTLHNLLKIHFLQCDDIPVNEKEADRIDIIYDEEDKPFYENRRKSYNQNTTLNEKKLFSVIDTWLPYSKKMCLNYFDIMHKITKINSIKTLKTYEPSISSQICQAMLDLPSTLENLVPNNLREPIIGSQVYDLLFQKESNFKINKYVYDDEIYYKKFLLSAIQTLKENRENEELLKSEKDIYKIKKFNVKKKKRSMSFDPIPQLINYMEPEGDNCDDNMYDYMDNPGFVDVILSSLFQQ